MLRGERVKVFAEESGTARLEPAALSGKPSSCNACQSAPISSMHLSPKPLALRPVLSSVAGHIHGQFQPAPDSQFVKDASQVILDDLLSSPRNPADLPIR